MDAQTKTVVPLILRGQVIDADVQEFQMRQGAGSFFAPDVSKYLNKLPTSPKSLNDLYSLDLEEIIKFMVEVGGALDMDINEHVRAAFEASVLTSGIAEPILDGMYRGLSSTYTYEYITRFVDVQIGREYLEGWVEVDISDSNRASIEKMSVRAVGARALHIIAGNTPGVAFLTVLRSAITRSDSIIKLPSNDPLTAVAILQTMIDMAPDHPVTKHLSAAYWKGGDERIEKSLYHPRNVEKIIAWGGFDSVSHIAKYLQPGIDLITLDPKHSCSIIGQEALRSDETIGMVAQFAARDIGAFNQEACANARVIYVICDESDPEQMAQLNKLGQRVLSSIQRLPERMSTPAKSVIPELQEQIAGVEMQEDFYKVFKTDSDKDGAVIVSQFDEAVEFSDLLANRTANLVPVSSVDDVLKRISAASQTVGVYPDSLRREIRDELALRGAQHIIPLGKVMQMGVLGPQDGLSVEHRMLKWIRDMDLNMGNELQVRELGSFNNKNVFGFFEPTIEASYPTTTMYGMRVDALVPSATLRDEDGNLWNVVRYFDHGSTTGLLLRTNKDGRKMWQNLTEADDRAYLGPVMNSNDEIVHTAIGVKQWDNRQPFRYRRWVDKMEWQEGDLLSLTGVSAAPGLSWYSPNEKGGWMFTSYLTRVEGTIMGRKCEGFSEFGTCWSAPGVSWNETYMQRGGVWLIVCNEYTDGTRDLCHIGYNVGDCQFAMMATENGPRVVTRDVSLAIELDKGGYPKQLDYVIDGEKWCWQGTPDGDLGDPNVGVERGREGIARREGDTRELSLAYAWVNFFSDSRIDSLVV